MRRLRTFALLLVPVVAMLVFADPALAFTHGGEGLFGPTDDVTITNTMFILIGFFPALIVVLSILQHFLDKRHHRKFAREKAAAAADPVQGGW
ncbi:MAG TPA: hypothetical protein VFN48_00385 [Solirubrobacteraceae bacterium]|nr:hypothetical protein [Solirubrobacteraceae bacterium]